MSTINIINASAGSGKTYRLTELACENINNGISAGQLFVTTFTKKAAAELEERLRQRLLSGNKSDEANLLSQGFVGTLGSVCTRLITEYAIDAGLSPVINVIPEEDMSNIFNMAIEDAIDKYADKLEPVARRLSRQGGGGQRDKKPDWRNDVNKIAKLARDNRLNSDAIKLSAEKSWESFSTLLGDAVECDTYASLIKAIQSAICTLEKLSSQRIGTQEVLEKLKEIQKASTGPDRMAWNNWATMAKFSPPKDGQAAVFEVKELACGWVNHPCFHEDVRTMIYGVFNCAVDAIEYYQEYKKLHGLMDFTDQEAHILDLLERKEPFFCNSLKERLSLLLVDEFQDTSPIELAIFLELNRLCGASFWIGDPKQSIYGFRSSDPVLMDTTADCFSNNSGGDANKPLTNSWRSRKLLVNFVNAVFKEVFHEMPENKVCLNIPDQRKADAEGGVLEAWFLDAENNKEDAACLAIAIQSLLSNAEDDYQKKDLKPGDIAVLCRSNDNCKSVSNALEDIGIRASTARGLLLKTPVCRLVLAAVRYLADKSDTLAMIELINFLPEYADSKDWLAKIVSDREGFLDELRSRPVFQSLDAQRKELCHWTPLQVLEYAIEASGAPEAASVWPNTALAMANLDKLRQSCVKYLDRCLQRRDSASLTGYLSYLTDTDIPEAEGSDEQTVQVLTYHAAKGLEWPVVILFSLGDGPRGSAFDLCAKADGEFDPQFPLNNRRLHFWPNPIPGKQTSDELKALLLNCTEQQEAINREVKESQRLLYVGFTRARDLLILAVQRRTTQSSIKLNTAWLDELTNAAKKPLITLPISNTEGKQAQAHTLTIGSTQIPITIREFTKNQEAAPLVKPAGNKRRPIIPAHLPDYPLFRYSPSDLESETEDLSKIQVSEVYRLGERIPVKGTPDYNYLGEAVHNFLALDQGKRNSMEWETLAQRLLDRYKVTGVMDPSDMVRIHERLTRFIKTSYPEAKIRREWPISLREPNNQVMHGWIDMLLELENGFVIIDHKTFPGTNAEERARQYTPQLNAYCCAVEAATGKNVLAKLIHMPVIGRIFDVH